jgi:hypothetical protein
LLQWRVYKWIEKFRNGYTNVMNEEEAGCLPMATNEDVKHAVDMVMSDRQVTTDKVANHLQITHCPAYEIIHNRFGFHKDCARWVSRQLTMLLKQTCLNICQQHPQLPSKKELKG